jgi:hypothetical protein
MAVQPSFFETFLQAPGLNGLRLIESLWCDAFNAQGRNCSHTAHALAGAAWLWSPQTV